KVLDRFREIVTIDFEFEALPGERQVPVCAVGWELRSGRRFRLFQGQFGSAPPWATGKDVLTIGYFLSAEGGCYRALRCPLPEYALDLFTEYRNLTNGLRMPPRSGGLVAALMYFGLEAHGSADKATLSETIGAGLWRGRYTPDQILQYCEN